MYKYVNIRLSRDHAWQVTSTNAPDKVMSDALVTTKRKKLFLA